MKQTFESYLQEQHADGYMGTDDAMPEAYETWISQLDTEELMNYADVYAHNCVNEALKAQYENK